MMAIEHKRFTLANVVLASAIAMALTGCGDENMYPDAKPPVVDPTPPVGPTPPVDPNPANGNDFVIFQDKVNSFWPAWDCCGGSTPSNPDVGGDKGLVTEFAVIQEKGETVLGFVRAEAKGPLDISAYAITGTLEFDIKLKTAPTNGPTQWFVKLESNGGLLAEKPGQQFEGGIAAPTSSWQTVKINIADMQNQGLDLTKIDNVLIYPKWGTGLGAVYQVDNVRFVIDGNSGKPNPEPNPEADKGLKYDLTKPLTDFGGNYSELVADPAPAFSVYNSAPQQVVKTLKTAGAETWAGTTLGDKPVIALTNDRSKISVWVYSEHASTPLRLKVENQLTAEKNVEVDAVTTVANQWEKITFDFSHPVGAGIDPAATYDMTSIFFDFGQPGSGKVFYWRDLTFVDAENSSVASTITLFKDAANPQWAAWDCCGGTKPAVIVDADPAYGEVTEFAITSPTVVGFTARDADGAVGGSPIDVNAWKAQGTISFDLKITQPGSVAEEWKFKVESAGGPGAGGGYAEVDLKNPPKVNQWSRYTITLKELVESKDKTNFDLSKIDLVMMFPKWETGIGTKFVVDNVVFSSLDNTAN